MAASRGHHPDPHNNTGPGETQHAISRSPSIASAPQRCTNPFAHTLCESKFHARSAEPGMLLAPPGSMLVMVLVPLLFIIGLIVPVMLVGMFYDAHK